jgi:tRNA A37 methylthiotransferase MiaB
MPLSSYSPEELAKAKEMNRKMRGAISHAKKARKKKTKKKEKKPKLVSKLTDKSRKALRKKQEKEEDKWDWSMTGTASATGDYPGFFAEESIDGEHIMSGMTSWDPNPH